MADAAKATDVRKPPLDKGFFKAAWRTKRNVTDLTEIQAYLRDKYAIENLRDPVIDSLEDVMVRIYGDIFDPSLGPAAYVAFLRLLQLFNRRLATTTNAIPMTPRRLLYRVIRRMVEEAGQSDELTIITFNQDIQIEKALSALDSRLPTRLGKAFAFPVLYGLGTVPTTVLTSAPSFPLTSGSPTDHTRLLKLHGSLNWYSVHRSNPPERSALFRSDRAITVTRRTEIAPDMRRSSKGKREFYTFPIVVPPVNHKTAILHDRLRPIWTEAETALAEATRVVVFGYSCPVTDFESANMISRAFNRNMVCDLLTIIDPDPRVLLRYAELTKMDAIRYFRSALPFLSSA